MIIGLVIGAVIFGGGGFYAGMTYSASSRPARSGAAFTRGAGGTGTTRGGTGGGFASGQVLAKDATSITIQLPNGAGSKIVLLSGTTPVMKTVDGTLADVTVGTTVVANGTANSDGSITAQSIQIRPAGSVIPGGAAGASGTNTQTNTTNP